MFLEPRGLTEDSILILMVEFESSSPQDQVRFNQMIDKAQRSKNCGIQAPLHEAEKGSASAHIYTPPHN